jgi:hypothetical protein
MSSAKPVEKTRLRTFYSASYDSCSQCNKFPWTLKDDTRDRAFATVAVEHANPAECGNLLRDDQRDSTRCGQTFGRRVRGIAAKSGPLPVATESAV